MAKMKTFYLYTEEWVLEKRSKRIYSPFNVPVMSWPPKFEMTYNEPKSIVFINWIYETEDAEELIWLSLYNNIWWKITVDWKDKNYKWDGTHQVKMEKIQSEIKEINIETKVEVSKIPRVFATSLTIEQLKSLCKDWWVTINETTSTKDDFIKLLDESGNIE